MNIQKAKNKDLPLLLEMNQQLMQDEKYDRPPSQPELLKRWDSFLSQDKFGVFLFKESQEIVGYAVVHLEDSPPYLRHFFIHRDHRRKGLGTRCFWALLDHIKTETIDLDVMTWNTRGQAFWKSLGFKERCRMMNLQIDSKD
ncbi:MAG: GNAT family N-acetyltransferase [Spirochaetaceae bacterium]|nr:GNAT family N-acetyltransferase [Spirochaetaceae bacterium]